VKGFFSHVEAVESESEKRIVHLKASEEEFETNWYDTELTFMKAGEMEA
jgi:hypothetical protein